MRPVLRLGLPGSTRFLAVRTGPSGDLESSAEAQLNRADPASWRVRIRMMNRVGNSAKTHRRDLVSVRDHARHRLGMADPVGDLLWGR